MPKLLRQKGAGDNLPPFGKTGISITPIGMGVMNIGIWDRVRSLTDGARLVRYAIEQGINFLDTAEAYDCYRYVRKALYDLEPSFSGNILARPAISGKSHAHDGDSMRRAIEDFRTALDIDIADIFLLDEVKHAADFESRRAAWEYLQEAKSKGQVKAIGISTHNKEAAALAGETAGMDAVFAQINIKDKSMESALSSAAKNGVGIAAMGILDGGNLLGNYTEAFDYVTNLRSVTSAIIGMGCKQDVDDAVAYIEGRLPPDYAPGFSDMRMFIDRTVCTKCGECVRYCATNFHAYSFGEDGYPVVDTEKCIRCGFCLPACPSRALLFL